MRLAVILACATLSTAATANPLVKRALCEENCRGTFDANGGGECGDVDECIANYCGCVDEGKDFTYGTCGCIDKGACDIYCKDKCLTACSAFDGNGFGDAVCQINCGPSCNCD